MKRYFLLLGVIILGSFVFSCQKVEVKPVSNTNVIVTPVKTNDVVTPVKTNVVVPVKTNVVVIPVKTNAVVVPDKFDNTDFKNVIKVLKEAIDKEKKNKIPANLIESGKAHALVAKFMREKISEPRYGFTEDDIESLKQMAIMKLRKALKNAGATEEEKKEAEREMEKASKI